jgi:hypothetical protein
VNLSGGHGTLDFARSRSAFTAAGLSYTLSHNTSLFLL